MDILFTGNLMPLSNSFFKELDRNLKLVVCGKSLITDYQSKNVNPYDYNEDELENLFRSFNFETVVYFSKALDGTKKVFDELESLENVLYLCKQYKVFNFIYVNTNDLAETENINKESSRYILLNACEHLCKIAYEEKSIHVSIVRVPYLYNMEQDGTHLATWIKTAVIENKLKLPGKSENIVSFLWDEDLARLIDRMIDEPYQGYLEMNVTGAESLSFFGLAEKFILQNPNLKISYKEHEVAIPNAMMNKNARSEFGWFPMGDFSEQLAKMITQEKALNIQKKRKKLLSNYPKLKNLFITAAEMIVLFVLVEFLDAKISDNPFLNFIDYRMLFVVILGATRGLNVGIVAAALASFSFVSNSLTNMNWQIIFYNTQNWLPFATYFLIGAVSGYTRDKIEDTIRFLKEEQVILEKKYVFLNELYVKTLDNKEEFSSQIMKYKDSYGKIYAVVKKLAATLPEQVFYEAINVLENIMENEYVAIYTVEKGSDFARLNVCSRSLNEKLSKSMRLSDYSELNSAVRNRETWVNIACIPEYPAYACPIFREEKLVGLITIYHVSDHQLCQEYRNKISIVSGLIQEFLVRAIERSELIERDTMIKDTKIMKQEYFSEIVAVKKQMKEKKFSEYVMVRIKRREESLQELSNKIVHLLRNNDVVGQGDDGEIYIMLSQTNAKYISIIENRMRENSIYFDIVNP